MYADGHEIASHTVTHSFGTNFNEEKWANEVVGEAELLVKFGGVNPADIKGMRAPFLAVGGDKMFNMLSRLENQLHFGESSPFFIFLWREFGDIVHRKLLNDRI